ncbi:hypothetical protein VOLCADRAFT_95761 [Volvox carteri f. nagariensis]|uniref:C2 domain-containing protein n=1 Tax=Volvox carteri f. nagariensis TaxID=3068 RepID=D8U8B4_VOLCA|nr:uncharacterized protein VOLCADRAFT_95761 [Volvox carteri f. nagariensis]EFJ44060.1 hypothetical protein VOLCADRAFT_95761 [Volvox carteri f. nagariensis]|eukprot:XP_002954861.1 hypothetical protein VOLCADRAFT_95761 [Volvox carteri f. nagariensis]
MALQAGVMSITVEHAKDLKSGDWFGKQDPYCILRVGCQQFRTQTAKDGGRNPVWHETFQIALMDENHVNMDVKDQDVGRDDLLGTASFSLARARQKGSDRQEVAVFSKKSRKQHGYVLVTLKWAPHGAQAGSAQPQVQVQMQAQSCLQPQHQSNPYGDAVEYGTQPLQQQLLLPSVPLSGMEIPVSEDSLAEAGYYCSAAAAAAAAGVAAAPPRTYGGYPSCVPHLVGQVPPSAMYQPALVTPSIYYHQ